MRSGGGTNHRMGLYDAIMIKDNHVALWGGGTIADAVLPPAPAFRLLKIEVEVDTLEQLAAVLPAEPDWVLLDNMTPETLTKAVKLCDGLCKTEASGGITLETIGAIAATGVDAVSVGALTHAAVAVDLGLDVDESFNSALSESGWVIDIGNTSAAMGFYVQERVSRVLHTPSDGSDSEAVLAWLEKDEAGAGGCGFGGTEGSGALEALLKAAGVSEGLWVDHRCDLGVGIDYPKPEQIGADRLANAAAAAYWIGLPAVVCDFGTALTFDVVAQKRGYVGGVICPGLPLMFDYLAEKTALLPTLKPLRSKAAIGRSTEQGHAHWRGAGRYRGMVREVLGEIKAELGVQQLSVCATGGHAAWVLKEAGMEMRIEKHLTLLGLGRIADLNASG